MARLISDFVTEVRRGVSDTRTPYRYSDDRILDVLNRGLDELARLRPDAFHDTFDVDDIVVPSYDSSQLGSAFPLNYLFYTPLVMFVIGSIELTDDEFTVDGRAITLLGQFKASVIGA